MRSLLLAALIAGCAATDTADAPFTRPPITTSPSALPSAPLPPAALSGRILDADGAPFPNAVIAVSPGIDWFANGPTATTTRSAPDGTFRFESLPGGSYGVTVTAPGRFGGYGGFFELAPSGQPVKTLDLRFTKSGFVVRGTVRDDRGDPVRGAAIEALAVPEAGSAENESTMYAFMTGDDGRFDLGLPADSPFLLVVSAPGRPRTYQRIDPTERSLDITLGRVAAPRPADGEIAAWLRTKAIPIATAAPGSPLDDLAMLMRLIGNARIVALGEATHGSTEIFQLKHRAVELLVENGFTVVAFEAGFAESLAVDAYLQTGKGDPVDVVRGLITDPYGTDEIVALVRSLRRMNADPRRKRKVRFMGFDPSTWTSGPELLRYLEQTGTDVASLTADLKPLTTFGADGSYAAVPPTDRAKTRAAVDRSASLLDQRRAELEKKTSAAAWSIARQHARILDQAERLFRDPTLRDTTMAQNVAWILDHEPAGTRVALWLHNAHAAAVPSHMHDMGRLLRSWYGRSYFVLGTAFGKGGIRAPAVGHGISEANVAGKPDPAGFDAALGLAGLPMFAIDLRTVPPGPVADWLASAMPTWSIGFRFRDDATAHVRLAPSRAFDAVMYVDKVRAARGLPKRKQ